MNNLKLSSIIFIIFTYCLGLYGLYSLILNFEHVSIYFLLFNLIYYCYTNISFTVGWHRYFVHKAFKTNKIIEWILFLGGASIFIGSLVEWIQDHYNHHKHLNTEEDPTNINKGFIYSHILWALSERPLQLSIKNKLFKNWHDYYLVYAVLSGLIFPVSISYLISQDFWLSLSISFGLRVMISQNIIGLLGSYCHRTGSEMSLDSHLISILCFGEGYQKYHHEFPGDYRNGIHLYSFDPSKWIIFIMKKLRIASDLRERSQ